jgi:hypothetical protein
MVYGELGRYPIDIDIKVRTISYWARLLSGKQAKFSNVFYRLSRNLNENGDTNIEDVDCGVQMFDFVLPGHKSNNYGSTFFVGIRSKSVSNVYITFFGVHVQFVI